MQVTTILFGLAATFGLASASPRPAPARSVAGETGCGAYGIYCDTNTTFSVCVPTSTGTEYFYFGSVAPGTYCDTTQMRIRADNYGNCSPDGQIFCGADGTTFFICDQGGLISFGPTAAGTECVNGQIIACDGPCGYPAPPPGPSPTYTTTSTIFSAFNTTSSASPSIFVSSTTLPNVTVTSSTSSSTTSSSTPPSTTTALGYYAAPADGDLLDGPVYTSPDMTEELCGSDCQGYPYFALLNGKHTQSICRILFR